MPTDIDQPVAAPVAVEKGVLIAPRQRGLPGRVWQWFWRGDEMRALARPIAAEPAEFFRRARLASEVARRTTESSEPFDGSIDPVLCDLYRQSVHWSLAALRCMRKADPGAALVSGGVGTTGFDVLDRSALLKAVGDPETLALVVSAVDALSFKEFVELAAPERARLLGALRAVAAMLIAELDISRRLVQALWLQRILRVGLLLVLLLVSAAAVAKVKDQGEQKRDLASGKAWRTSSWYGGCHSPEQECADSADYFFHTQDENSPWIEFDLATKVRFSAVRVDNRKDCCSERAAPMVVEVSNDDKKWRAVARREAVFKSWFAEFPATEARWVRLRVEGRGPLHLVRVRVLR